MADVLVAYATKYGSTREVAEAVAATLRERGLEVDVRSARDVKGLDGYRAVVLGGALYFFHWRGDAHRFLRRNRAALSRVPVAVFAMGPINDTAEEFTGARGQLDRALAKHAWFSPVSLAIFGGRLDPTGLRFPDGNPAVKRMPASDIRDWDAIEAWANSLSESLDLTEETRP